MEFIFCVFSSEAPGNRFPIVIAKICMADVNQKFRQREEVALVARISELLGDSCGRTQFIVLLYCTGLKIINIDTYVYKYYVELL